MILCLYVKRYCPVPIQTVLCSRTVFAAVMFKIVQGSGEEGRRKTETDRQREGGHVYESACTCVCVCACVCVCVCVRERERICIFSNDKCTNMSKRSKKSSTNC